MRNVLSNTSIATKIYFVVSTLIIMMLIGALGLGTIHLLAKEVDGMENSLRRALLGEKINAQVLSVVADSRGIYMSATPEEANKYAKPLVTTLGKIDATLKEQKALLPAGRVGELDETEAKVAEFIQFRTELARLSQEVGVTEARQFGDNDANRSNRKKLNELIVASAEKNVQEIEVNETALQKFQRRSFIGISAMAALGTVLGALMGWLVARFGILRPLFAIRESMIALASGKLDVAIPGENRRDELGNMAAAVSTFKTNAVERKALDEAARSAQQAKEKRQVRIEKILGNFNSRIAAVVSNITQASKELSGTADNLSHSAQRTNEESTHAATAADVTSQNVQSVASAAEQMGSTVQEITTQVSRSTSVVTEAMEKVLAADQSANELLKTSESIDAITTMIESIAGQINLLALNATIESARAGEAGRGFAVVASEVKNLATQATKATEQIRSQLETVKGMSQSVARELAVVKSSVGRANEYSSAIAAAVEEQSVATKEIVQNMQVAAQGVVQISGSMGTIRQSAETTNTATDALLKSSKSLLGQSTDLDDEVRRFVVDIQQAQAS